MKMKFCVAVWVSMLCLGVYAVPETSKETQKFPYYSRHSWGAAPANGTEPLKIPVPYVVIHHTYIPAACYNFKQCSLSMKSMQNYHNILGWGDIGYNFCVGSDGGAYEGRGWHTIGIHTGKANSHSIGICLIGDWEAALPPAVQLQTTRSLIEAGVKNGSIRKDYKLIAHRQVMTTQCPGTRLYEEMKRWPHFNPHGFSETALH